MLHIPRLRANASRRRAARSLLSLPTQHAGYWILALALAALMGFGAFSSAIAQGTDPVAPVTEEGYYYTVQAGDSWSVIARKVGVHISELYAANPQARRANDVLRPGQQLLIPGPAPEGTEGTEFAATPASTEARYHTVGAGQSWNSIAALYGLRGSELRAANPDSVRAGLVLYRGERLLIPAAGSGDPLQGAAFATPTPLAATPTLTPSPTASPTPTLTFTPSPTPTDVTTTGKDAEPDDAVSGAAPTVESPIAEPTPTVEPTATVVTAIGVSCPAIAADYPAQINSILNTESFGMEGLRSWLEDCGASVENGLITRDLTGDDTEELIVLYVYPNAPEGTTVGDMIVLHYGDAGFAEAYRARASGKVQLWRTEDINADGKLDIVYSDTSCGASTCFDTLHVVSWDGGAWQSWTADQIGMAFAEYRVIEASDAGQGNEIVISGGVLGSTGAGPQRSRTETWASIEGAPYTLLERTYDESECLYFAVIDANELFNQLPDADLAELEHAYTRAATDPALKTCWTRENEESELRSFSLFRLALVAAYQGVPEISGDLFASISQIYPDSAYGPAGQVWLENYAETEDISAACAAVNAHAAENLELSEYLSGYGYANPGFSPNDVCPVAGIEAAENAAQAAPVAADVQTILGMAPTPTVVSPLPTVEGSEVVTLPDCPDVLADFTSVMPAVLSSAANDVLAAGDWLRDCDAMNDTRGVVAVGDYSGDGVDDAIVVPVVVSDTGFGPRGTQGAVLIYNGDGRGSYTLAANPEVYGQADLLTVQDLNGDGVREIAWTVTGCSTFCATEVQIVSWDAASESYISRIQPGATLFEGKAEIAQLPEGAPGSGMALILNGGVSGTPEGGLETPHTEVWQSVDGAPFQRISWTYDRESEGNECLGLRMVEADVLLQASSALGFGPAIAAYEATFAPELKACSIFGVDGTEELVLLQGLATFRLVQAQLLAGDQTGAQESLAALTQGQPEGPFTAAAQTWAANFVENDDAEAACAAVSSFFAANELTWQITDHFGYNHPALAAEQLCFVPHS